MTADGESEGHVPDPGRWLEGEVERRHPEVSETHAEYGGWLIGFLPVDAATCRAEGIRVPPPQKGSPKRHGGNRERITLSARSPRPTAPGTCAG